MFKEGQIVEIVGYFHKPMKAKILETQEDFDVTVCLVILEGAFNNYKMYVPINFVHPVSEGDDVQVFKDLNELRSGMDD
jgi:hypothetical protein